MRHNAQVVVRLPEALVDRLDRLVAPLSVDSDLASAARVTRSTVARLALSRGLAVLESEHQGIRADGGE
jgi:hypothetical protein